MYVWCHVCVKDIVTCEVCDYVMSVIMFYELCNFVLLVVFCDAVVILCYGMCYVMRVIICYVS